MGGQQLIEKQFLFGKVVSPLSKKLKNVKWGEYKIEDLFDKVELKSIYPKNFDKNKDVSTLKNGEFDIPLVNAKHGNNGIMYYGRSSDFEAVEKTIGIIGDGAVSTGDVNPQPQKTGVLYNAYLIKPVWKNITQNQLFFLSSCLQKSIKLKFGYENKAGWEKVKREKIQLPIDKGEIDFDFMEKFIAELEAERIAELEVYLSVTGLRDYVLTTEEQKALDDFNNIMFEDHNIIDLFTVKNSGNILSREIKENSGQTPYLCASSENNAVSSYISYDNKYLDKGNCIFIGGKTFVVTYQEKDFYSNDSHNLVLYIKDNKEQSKSNQLYLATCINKSLKHKYSWGDSISNKKIQNDKISLPTINHQPNYKIMETLISAVQKLVIKDVVLYADNKINATKTVIEGNKA